MKETLEIQKSNKVYLIEKIEQLNKKCRKLNCPEMILTFGPERIVEIKDKNDQVTAVEVLVEVTLDYEIPIIEGWELICTFDIVEDKVFTSKVPDKEIPIEYLNKTEIHCDHCGVNRYRTHSMLMRNINTNEYKEVGSTCVKDFFGYSPKNLLWMASIRFTEIVDSIRGYGEARGSVYAYPLNSFLSITNACIKNFGWVPRSKEDEWGKCATVEQVFAQISLRRNRPTHSDIVEITKEDEKMAEETIEYFVNLDPEDNDYLNNCVKIVDLGYIPYKMTGVAASMIAAYKRATKERLERESRPISNWIGNVKDKITVLAKCVYKMNVESMYGVSTLYIFVDKNGNKLKTFYSGSGWDCDQGDNVILSGTVKNHDEYKNEKATQLTRCKVVEDKNTE